ncbi:unnamed protein product [Nippostrongylus brasiliensis]|uniref:Uncharacterized protein n=1 Tax=Nippostrongylus brasiliensis TaxID=27835 RepID=A0A0N4YL80_NIPBR|nr:unnamed protein product [Nippostrongylus brasiliensis]
MTSFLAADLLAQLLCVLAVILKLQLLVAYRRVPRYQRNLHFDLYLLSSLLFAAVSFVLSFGEYISRNFLSCTTLTTVLVFMICQNLNDAALISYGLAFFPGFNTFINVVFSVIIALGLGIAELMFTYNASSEIEANECHSTFVSSRDGVVATIVIHLVYFAAMALLTTIVAIHKEKEDNIKRIGTHRITVWSILVIGCLTSISVSILSVANLENYGLLTYSNLTIIYSAEGCLVAIASIITCPIARKLLIEAISTKKKKARVNTLPRQQLYCSFALRSHRKKKQTAEVGEQSDPQKEIPTASESAFQQESPNISQIDAVPTTASAKNRID